MAGLLSLAFQLKFELIRSRRADIGYQCAHTIVAFGQGFLSDGFSSSSLCTTRKDAGCVDLHPVLPFLGHRLEVAILYTASVRTLTLVGGDEEDVPDFHRLAIVGHVASHLVHPGTGRTTQENKRHRCQSPRTKRSQHESL